MGESWNLNTASTTILAKNSFSCVNNLELRVVLAMLIRSFLKFSLLAELLKAIFKSVSFALSLAARYPAIMIWGAIFWLTSFTPSLRSSPHKTATVVVPSPTTESWVFEISIKIFAAGLSTYTLFKIVAPSFVIIFDYIYKYHFFVSSFSTHWL